MLDYESYICRERLGLSSTSILWPMLTHVQVVVVAMDGAEALEG